VVLDHAPQSRRPRTAQDRINILTKRYRQSEEQKSTLEQQVQLLVDKLQYQDRVLQDIAQGRAPAQQAFQPAPAPAPANGSLETILDQQAQPPQQLQPGVATPAQDRPLTAQEVKEIVSGAIQDFATQSIEQQNQVGRLQTAQEESFQEAVEDFPQLADQRTTARQLFNKIYSTSPLRQLPDAPYQIALQVQGILWPQCRGSETGRSCAHPATCNPGHSRTTKDWRPAGAPEPRWPDSGRRQLVRHLPQVALPTGISETPTTIGDFQCLVPGKVSLNQKPLKFGKVLYG
jgi:hypothetical protein